MPHAIDIQHMQHALRLAARGLGNVAPNPSVGAVIVKDGSIIGTGVTARGGRPHAETQALAMAGRDARGATLYVTLEPCSHHGKTPPCAEAIIAAGIVKVICAVGDSNPLVAGKGIALLRAAGIEVIEDVCSAEARALNAGFFSVLEKHRPYVSLKIATSRDGRTATRPGEDRWITGEQARLHGHYLRATHDAILTGIGTQLVDDPALTCRLPGREQDSPLRILFDTHLRISPNANILPAWIFTSEQAYVARAEEVLLLERETGSRVFPVGLNWGRLSLPAILAILAREGVTRLLVEAGKTLSEAFFDADLVDRIYWFRAPRIIGDEASVIRLPIQAPAQTLPLGTDSLEIYDL